MTPVAVALIYVIAWVMAFPPFTQAWTVFIFLTPFIKWSFARPRWRTYFATAFFGSWAAWFFILFWLRNVYPVWGWVGLALLSGILAFFPAAWLAAMRWAAPRLRAAPRWRRMFGLFALAGLWIVLDWVRGWLFTGFPWLPLAAAFWKFPLLLQLSEWTGQWGVTFLVVLVNLGLVCGTGRETVSDKPPKIWWPGRCGPEILVPLLLLTGAILLNFGLYFREQRGAPDAGSDAGRPIRPLLRAGFVQPWSELKWSAGTAQKNWETLRDLTLSFSSMNVDVILWPEAAPPFAITGGDTEEARAELQALVNRVGKPLLFGGIGMVQSSPGGRDSLGFSNSVYLMSPRKGLETASYAKRHLVPFGEYVPWRSVFSFVGKVVPLEHDTVRGERAEVLPLRARDGHVVNAGPLLCYEDVFPALAREEVKAGADILVVLTNDAWYGQEGGALQHAAHSVLRAVETRRPVLRCGNNGWSGVIDQDGYAFPLLKDGEEVKSSWILHAQGSTYFRGAEAMNVYPNPAFEERQTFYVRFGDWFVALSGLLALGGAAALRRGPAAA